MCESSLDCIGILKVCSSTSSTAPPQAKRSRSSAQQPNQSRSPSTSAVRLVFRAQVPDGGGVRHLSAISTPIQCGVVAQCLL